MKPAESEILPQIMENAIFHENHEEESFPRSLSEKHFFRKPGRMQFFMRSMQDAILHGSMAKPSFCVTSGICNSARRPRKREILHGILEQ